MEEELYRFEDVDAIRMPWNIWPRSKVEALKCVLPFSALYTPVKPLENLIVRYVIQLAPRGSPLAMPCSRDACPAGLAPRCAQLARLTRSIARPVAACAAPHRQSRRLGTDSGSLQRAGGINRASALRYLVALPLWTHRTSPSEA